ncbi:protoporphyrinogen oxidase [Jannaschia sp. EhC01]|nr:protoporphyrinogen oxidase [Jannaschia sp. EhC01]
MNVLILYASVEGQTGKIARVIEKQVKELGHEATLANADDPVPCDIASRDAVILAAPVHQRRHPRTFEALLSARKDDLEDRKVLLLSVSLNAAFPEGREEAEDYLVEMKMRTGLEPDAELLVAGAVRFGEYDYFARQVVQHVVLRGHEYDGPQDEHEFTDWTQVANTVEGFLAT